MSNRPWESMGWYHEEDWINRKKYDEEETSLAKKHANTMKERIAELERIHKIDKEYIERSQANDERLCAEIKDKEARIAELEKENLYIRTGWMGASWTRDELKEKIIEKDAQLKIAREALEKICDSGIVEDIAYEALKKMSEE